MSRAERAMGPPWSIVQHKGKNSVSAGAPVGRLESSHAAARSRNTDRAAGVAPRRGRQHLQRQCGPRAAARTACVTLEIPRIVHRTEQQILIGGTIRELLRVQLSEQNHSGCPQACDDRRVLRGHEIGADLRTGGGSQPLRPVQVLVGDGDAVQRPASSPPNDLGLGRAGFLEGGLGPQRDEGVDCRVAGGNPIEAGLGDVKR